jgi:hypothetical protein
MYWIKDYEGDYINIEKAFAITSLPIGENEYAVKAFFNFTESRAIYDIAHFDTLDKAQSFADDLIHKSMRGF